MELCTFDQIYQDILLVHVNQMRQEYCFDFNDRCKQSIFESYTLLRDFVKKAFMDKDLTSVLDRHKIAACMMMAIIRIKPLTKISGAPYLNELLAVKVALDIVCSFLMQSSDSIYKNGFRFPPTSNGQSFIYGLCLSLYNVECTCAADMLAYANVFFLIEAYTRAMVEKEAEQKVIS